MPPQKLEIKGNPSREKEHQILQVYFGETLESAFVNKPGRLARAEEVFAELDARVQRGNHREDANPPLKE